MTGIVVKFMKPSPWINMFLSVSAGSSNSQIYIKYFGKCFLLKIVFVSKDFRNMNHYRASNYYYFF